MVRMEVEAFYSVNISRGCFYKEQFLIILNQKIYHISKNYVRFDTKCRKLWYTTV